MKQLTYPTILVCEPTQPLNEYLLVDYLIDFVNLLVKQKGFDDFFEKETKHDIYRKASKKNEKNTYIEFWQPKERTNYSTISWKTTETAIIHDLRYGTTKEVENISTGGLSFKFEDNKLYISAEAQENGKQQSAFENTELQDYFTGLFDFLEFRVINRTDTYEQAVRTLEKLKQFENNGE